METDLKLTQVEVRSGRRTLVLLRTVYIVAYRDDKPSEIFFAGYSFD